MPEPPEDQKTEETQDVDPLLGQAERLPAFVRGADGDASTAQHVRPVEGDEEDVEPVEDPFGYEPPDPSTFTAD